MTCKTCNTPVVSCSCSDSNVTTLPPITTVTPVNHCPDNLIVSIGKVKDKIVVTMNDCTFYETNLNKLDLISFMNTLKVVTKVAIKDSDFIFTLRDPVSNTDTELVITPPKATNNIYGMVKYATDVEALVSTLVDVSMNPKTTLALILQELAKEDNYPKASYANIGVTKYADITDVKAKSGTTALTPEMAEELVKELLKTITVPEATTTTLGSVKKGIAMLDNSGNPLGYLVQ